MLGAAGLSLADLLHAEARGSGNTTRARRPSAIILWMRGGPSHIDMWDPKPDAPVEYRGEFGVRPTSVPGIVLSDMLPLCGRVMDRWSIIRSLHHHDAGHSREAQQALGELRALYEAKPTGDGAFWIALAYVSLGDTTRALDWLDKAIDANSSRLAYARVDSRLDPIRRDPRFIARMARIDKGTSVVDDPPARPAVNP